MSSKTPFRIPAPLVSGEAREVVQQLFMAGPAPDGDLISKAGRDWLMTEGLVARGYGWNWLTDEGVALALECGFGQRKGRR